LHVDGLHGLMMVIPTASCMLLLCVGLSEAIEPEVFPAGITRQHSFGFTAEVESGVAQARAMPSYPLKLPDPSKEGFRGQAQSRRRWWAGVSGCVAHKNNGCDY
jgi:hypothetical protein